MIYKQQLHYLIFCLTIKENEKVFFMRHRKMEY